MYLLLIVLRPTKHACGITRGYAISAAEHELGRPFMVVAGQPLSQTGSAMVGHAGRPRSVTVSHGWEWHTMHNPAMKTLTSKPCAILQIA